AGAPAAAANQAGADGVAAGGVDVGQQVRRRQGGAGRGRGFQEAAPRGGLTKHEFSLQLMERKSPRGCAWYLGTFSFFLGSENETERSKKEKVPKYQGPPLSALARGERPQALQIVLLLDRPHNPKSAEFGVGQPPDALRPLR